MIEFDKVVFPCVAEHKVEDFWQECLVLGVFTEGSSVSAVRNMNVFIFIIDNEGLNKKIFNISNVRFTRYSKPTS